MSLTLPPQLNFILKVKKLRVSSYVKSHHSRKRKANLCINADLNENCSCFVFVLKLAQLLMKNVLQTHFVTVIKTLAKTLVPPCKEKEVKTPPPKMCYITVLDFQTHSHTTGLQNSCLKLMPVKFHLFWNALWGQFNIFQTHPPPIAGYWKIAAKCQEMVLSCSNVFICPVSELLNHSTSLLPQPSDVLVIPRAGRWFEHDFCQTFVTHNQTCLQRVPSEKNQNNNTCKE